MRNLRVQGGLMTAASLVLVTGGCSTPDLATNLRPEGDPEVLSVLVMNDPDAYLRESATYCADDVKAPGTVGLPDFTTKKVCENGQAFDDENGYGTPVPVDIATGAVPDGWYARIMFDELLDPDVETLVETSDGSGIYEGHINTTLPVTLICDGVEIAYDGYYVPNGNNVTWPLGPSLVVFPADYSTIATGSTCSVELKDNVVDKDGNQVPAAQRGPFEFVLGDLAILAIAPDPDSSVEAETQVIVEFNQAVADGSLSPAEVEILADGVAVTATISTDGPDFLIAPVGGFDPAAEYQVSVLADAQVADLGGGTYTFADGDVALALNPICGSGRLIGSEACDDGNTSNADGCSDACVVEDGFTCTGEPSVCTAN